MWGRRAAVSEWRTRSGRCIEEPVAQHRERKRGDLHAKPRTDRSPLLQMFSKGLPHDGHPAEQPAGGGLQDADVHAAGKLTAHPVAQVARVWIPAFAGMTAFEGPFSCRLQRVTTVLR